MSCITSFMDGEEYGAQDINKVVSRFVHSGVEEAFVDGEPYNVRRLNDLSKPVTTRGVIGSESAALAVEKIGDSYYISPGTAFFGNGSTLEVTANEPITLSNTSAVNYVYLVSNEDENRNYIQVSTVEPELSNENVVMLAEISSDGAVTDRRCYATGKLRGMYQNNEFTLKSICVQDTLEFTSEQSEINIIQDLECSSFHMMVFSRWMNRTEDGSLAYLPSSFYDYQYPLRAQDGYSYLTVWLVPENRFFGIRDPQAYSYFNSWDTSGYVHYNRFQGNVFCVHNERVTLEITHASGTKWNFKYKHHSNIDATYNIYYKLYYI